MSGMKLDELYIEIKTKTDNLERELSDIKNSVNKIGNEAESTETKLSKWGATASGINQLFSTIKETIGQVKEIIGEASSKAAELEVMRGYFKGSAEDLENMRRAVAGTVGEAGLIQLSNQAESMGVAIKQQPLLFGIAENAANKFGTNVETAFNKIIMATEGNNKALKSLGIQKAVYKQILDDTVASTGKELSDMDAEEQKEIRMQAIIRASGLTMEELKNRVDNLREQQLQLGVSIDEAKEKFGQLINNALRPFLSLLASDNTLKNWIGGFSVFGNIAIQIAPFIAQLKEIQLLTRNLALTQVATEAATVGTATATATPGVVGFFGALKTGFLSIAGYAAIGAAVGIGIGELIDYIKDGNKELAEESAKTLQLEKNNKLNELISSNKRYIPGKNGQIIEVTIVENKDSDKTVSQIKQKIENLKKLQDDLKPGSKELSNNWKEISNLEKLIAAPEKSKLKTNFFEDFDNEKKELLEVNKQLENRNLTDAHRNILLERQKELSAKIFKYDHPDTNVNELPNTGKLPAIGKQGVKLNTSPEINKPSMYNEEISPDVIMEDWVKQSQIGGIAMDSFIDGAMSGFDKLRVKAADDAGAMQTAFVGFANSAISAIEQIIAKWAVLNLIGLVGGGGGYNIFKMLGFHDGGTFQDGKKIASFAGGGSFTVPQGYPHDSYPMLVESGERVSVTPSGAVGQQEKLLAQVIGRLDALNINMVNNRPIVNVSSEIKGTDLVNKVITPITNRTIKSGKNMDQII